MCIKYIFAHLQESISQRTRLQYSDKFIEIVKQGLSTILPCTIILIRPVSSAAKGGHQFLRAMDILSLMISM